MATQTLTATPFVPDGPGLDITALLATPTGTTLQFSNSGREMLLVAAAAGSETVTVDIGATVLGQAISNFTTVTLTSGHTVAFGPYHSLLDLPGGQTVQVVLSTITSIQVALVQTAAVY
jgi:hypothetical protein